MALDTVYLLDIGSNFMEIGQDHVGLVAVTGEADPGIGVNRLEAVLHRALFFIV